MNKCDSSALTSVRFPNESFFQFTFVHENRRASFELLLKTLLALLRDGDVSLAQDLAYFLNLPLQSLTHSAANEKRPDMANGAYDELVTKSSSIGLECGIS